MSDIVADASGNGWHAVLPPGMLLAASVTLITWLQFAPQPSKPVVVFFAPGTDRANALMAAAAAGSRIIEAGAWDNSLIVQSADPDFFRRLRSAGAWLIADASGRGGCITTKPNSST